ncbi:MAG TPA: hypothetical protein VM328_11655 [Fimbriimonadaceae bacterium]|nr:hypothetical protein [Fimbriimonadaceae bacterium]
MPENYASASEVVRNLAQLSGWEVLEEHGKFRIVRLPPPFFEGSELWVVNEKGFLWEPAASLEGARAYLDSHEARAYQAG